MKITEKELSLSFYDCLDDFETVKDFWKYISSVIDFEAVENPIEIMRYTRRYFLAMKNKCANIDINNIGLSPLCTNKRLQKSDYICVYCGKPIINITGTTLKPIPIKIGRQK